MEEEESLENKIDNAVNEGIVSLSLDSMELEEIPCKILSTLAENRALKSLNLQYNDLTSLPEAVGLLRSLENLYLTGNQLESLPNTIGELGNLKQIDLNENCITELPRSFSKLHKLQILNIMANRLRKFEEDVGHGLQSLEELRADENKLQCLPESFTTLKKLKVLEVAENQLSNLPEKFGDLKELRILNLSENNIEHLPASFSELARLISVDISNNHMEFLPDTFQSAEKLQYFYAVNNMYKVLPHWFEKLHSIVELNLSDNQLGDLALPLNFGDVAGKTLVLLDLSGNNMTALPDSIGQLKRLETFHLGSTICELERKAFQNGNWLPRLPETFGQLTSLTKLHLDENKLASFPESFGELKSLQWLDVSQNLIRQLPKSFSKLSNLWYLQFSKNNLESLPDDIGNLKNLVELRLDNNYISTLPESFADLEKIETVDLFCNQLAEIPKVLLRLRNLKRLDLDGNKLNIKDDKVPKLTTPVQYAPRNPALEGTWRGKAREDKQEQFFCVDNEPKSIAELVETAELEEKTEEDMEKKEYTYDEQVLEMALKRSMSLWRSHTGPETRERERNFIPHVENPVSDIFEDAISENNSNVNNIALNSDINTAYENSGNVQLVTDEWDREVEETWQNSLNLKGLYTKKIETPIKDQLRDLICCYPPAKQAFTKVAMYDSIFNKYPIESNRKNDMDSGIGDMSGQFDDAGD